MKINTILNRYIFRELISPFAISFLFLTFIFLMTRIPQITNMVVNYNTKIIDILLLIVCSLPRFMEFTIPISVMLSVLTGFIRMSRDNEITALKAGGIIVYRLLVPVIFFCILATLLTLWINVYAQPWGNRTVESQGIKIARSSFNIALKERRFNNISNGIMIYFNSKDIRTKQLKNVYIEDSRINGKISISIAPAGILFSEPQKMSYTLRLYNGMINQVDIETKSVNTVHFTTYDINFDFHQLKHRSNRKSKDIDEMSIKELMLFAKKYQKTKKF